MRTALATQLDEGTPKRVRVQTTLLELVRVVSEVTDDDAEVVGTILSLLRSGRVELCGSFKNEPIESF
jgi:hypothetical protein